MSAMTINYKQEAPGASEALRLQASTPEPIKAHKITLQTTVK